jgi:hypothetical protein
MSALDELQKKYDAGTLDDVELAIWWFAGFDKSYNAGKVDHAEAAAKKYAQLVAADADAAELAAACEHIRSACTSDSFVKIQGDLIGQVIFGGAAEHIDAALAAHEARKAGK